MLPSFKCERFLFPQGERVPEHIDESPYAADEYDDTLWHIGCEDKFDHRSEYIVAINIATEGLANYLLTAWQRQNLRNGSGGFGSVQDAAFIIRPVRRVGRCDG